MLTINFRDFPLRAGDVVLDVGCGEGRHAINAYLQAPVLSIGCDLNLHDLHTAQSRAQPFLQTGREQALVFSQLDATRLPFADASIDKIICSEVLEHIPAYPQVINEMLRVLKPGGLLAISVPRAWPERICWWLSREYHQVEGGHIRIFNAKKLRGEIEQQGAIFYRRHFAHALHSPYWWLRCLFWQSQERNWLIKMYHRLLVWDLLQKPWLTQTLEKLLNPIMGKSVVMYFKKANPTPTLPLAGEGATFSPPFRGAALSSPPPYEGGGREGVKGKDTP